MKSGKECEIKLDTPILLQLNEIQLSEGDTQRLKQCYWDLAQKLITKPHPLKESTFFSSHVGRSKKIIWRWPGWKTLFKSVSPHKTKYLIRNRVCNKWQNNLFGVYTLRVNYSAKMTDVLSTIPYKVLIESLQLILLSSCLRKARNGLVSILYV